RRHGEADARLPGEKAGDGGGIAGTLLVTEGKHADARGLRHAAEIGDRDARHAVDRGEAVELQRVDDEVEAVGQLLALIRRLGLLLACRCVRHDRLPGIDYSKEFQLFSTCAARSSACFSTSAAARSVSRRSSASIMFM